MPEQYEFFATTAKGIEPLLAAELKQIGALNIQQARAGAKFTGTLKTAYLVCLWSRTANRVLLPLKSFPAPTPEKLYGGTKSIRWSDHLSSNGTLAVDFASSESKITHTYFGALKVKDAIVDQFRSTHGERPSIDTATPDLRVNVYLYKDQATVNIDLSGESLHRRGYRQQGVFAPLKENLAAAILSLAGWNDQLNDYCFLDAMCGSGTLPIEAGMIASKIAPGLHRNYFGFKHWKGHSSKIWDELLSEAQDCVIRDRKLLPKIIGYDQDARAIKTSIGNAERAGLHGLVHFEKLSLREVQTVGPRGIIVLNPPYGERLGEEEELKPLYRSIGDLFKQKFKGWKGFVFTGNPELAKNVGLKASRRHVLFNGALECRLLEYQLY